MASKKVDKKGNESVQVTEALAKDYAISDIRRIAKGVGDSDVSRDYYRAHGKFPESVYGRLFGDFAAFKKKAFTTGWSYETLSEPTEEQVIKEFQNTLKKFLKDSEDGKVSVKDITKKYYQSNAYFPGFIEKYFSSFEAAKHQIILTTYGPTRDDLDHLKKKHKKTADIETMVFTAVMPAADLYKPGYSSIQTFLKKRGAKLHILPTRGLHHKHIHYEEEVAALEEYFVTELSISENLVAKDVKAYATIPYPLSWKTIELAKLENKSAIIAHPKQHFKAIVVQDWEKPQMAMTTGFITTRKWFNTESHYLAQRKSVLGGVILEIDYKKKLFFARHFQFSKDGSFTDLGKRYFPDGSVKDEPPAHLTIGDYHSGHTEQHALDATYKMIRELGVKRVSLHDVMDGQSINPHEADDIIAQIDRPEWAESLEKELHLLGKNLTEFVSKVPKNVQIDIVASNHDDFLERYLRKERFKGDRVNAALAWNLANAMIEHRRKSASREILNPVKYWVEKNYPNLVGRINWFKLGEVCRITDKKIDIASHGHKGPRGAKGTTKNYKLSLGACNIGHHHEPEVIDDVWVAGTLARYFDYNRGQSSGTQNANIATYEDGSRQILWISRTGDYHI